MNRFIRIALASIFASLLVAQPGPATAQKPVASPTGPAVSPSPQAQPGTQTAPATKPATLKQAYVPSARAWVKFVHRQAMKGRAPQRTFHLPRSDLPAIQLPVDNTGNQTVPCPIDGNDQYGDCGEAMAAHADNIYTYRQGKGTASVFSQTALISQYLSVSGGDNGLDEDDVVNAIWKVGIGGNAQAVIVDSLDIDCTNVSLTQYALYNFGTVQVAWSVPDDFVQNFATGSKWLNADIPDPANGHFTPISDIDAAGNYSLWTWGSYCWVSPAFLASVQPQAFVVFSPRNFDPATGLDSKGRHITTQAAAWTACGGNPIPQSVISAFPPIAPAPTPVVNPTPPTPVVNPPAPPVVNPTPVASPLVILITTPGSPTITIAVPVGSSVSIGASTLTVYGSQSISVTLPAGSSISILPGSTPPTPSQGGGKPASAIPAKRAA